MLVRSWIVMLVNIAVGVVTMVLVLGENVFWHLQVVDQLYANFGTNPGDMFAFLFVTEFVVIWGFGMIWITGFTEQLSRWLGLN